MKILKWLHTYYLSDVGSVDDGDLPSVCQKGFLTKLVDVVVADPGYLNWSSCDLGFEFSVVTVWLLGEGRREGQSELTPTSKPSTG